MVALISPNPEPLTRIYEFGEVVSESEDIWLIVRSLVQIFKFEWPVAAMDLPPAWSQTCVCGRTFSLPQAYAFHQRSCQRTKKRLVGALEKAKYILQARKRRKVKGSRLVRIPYKIQAAQWNVAKSRRTGKTVTEEYVYIFTLPWQWHSQPDGCNWKVGL